MSAHVALVTGSHLCRNPRVVKEADALSAAGHRVTVLGPVLQAGLAELDRALAADAPWTHRVAVDLRPRRGVATRLRRRLAVEAVRRGAALPDALGYGVRRTLRAARALDADLVIGHQEVGLWVADRMAREGARVGVDLEDWYSEDLLPAARAGRPVALLRALERAAVRRGGHVTTTSGALADALAEAPGGPRPTAVYNAFPFADRAALDGVPRDRPDRTRPSLHWVSQTVGPGRGLEVLFEALASVAPPVDLHLRGACSAAAAARLHRAFPAEAGHRLRIHGLVPPGELLGRIAEHDVGLALEATSPPNKDLTVSNKILHYLVGGLAVVATATAGQREVAAAAPGAVALCRPDDPAGLAAALSALAGSPEALVAARRAALEAARATFCWERQAPRLVASVADALAAP